LPLLLLVLRFVALVVAWVSLLLRVGGDCPRVLLASPDAAATAVVAAGSSVVTAAAAAVAAT
jgi:uncharacterized RDD family membrane protein YckC